MAETFPVSPFVNPAPFVVSIALPGGGVQVLDESQSVCMLSDATALMAALAPAATGPSGPHPKALLMVVDETPFGSVFGWRTPPGDPRRLYSFYTNIGTAAAPVEGVLVASTVAYMLAIQWANGVGAGGSWQYLPTPGAAAFKNFQWVPAPEVAVVVSPENSLATARANLAFWQQQVTALSAPAA